ncbi:uncharacterized protein LOC131023626 [Salvia miltiorrhiza]|uniref:uncharacterized protein LOC131023626 n=1 Tax=Salvia miltiorrhiza TaxID=226208 RepID=UPI0025ABD8FA|nr:uncharacterized protein LOC131023626 [Salvia miltiorrhiza]
MASFQNKHLWLKRNRFISLPSSDVDLVVSLPPVRNLEPIKEAGILEGLNVIKETCLQGLNSNLLCLLPKKTDAVLVSDFRPIVLGNFLFKVITKILASRLNEVAAVIVSANQFGFISGRSIQECILLASEGVNCMERSIQGRNMALKVDIRKAFDTLNWDFVEVVLDCFGFLQTFRHWIRVIFQSARISVLFNGEQHGYFGCSRGVRQGDPLSPVLFALAEEVLSSMLSDAADRGFIARMRMSRSLLFPSHLLYADDVLLFCKATWRSCRMIESILHIYALVSGQFCNKAKSKVFFGKGVSVQLRRRLQRDLGFSTGSLPFIYLGVPIFAGRASAARLISTRDRIIAHFPRWQGMQLSMAGRLCLVTSVIQSAAVHSMLIYRWPTKLLHDLDRACRSFIWTGCTTSRPKSSVAWNRVCAPKTQGGLNVKSFTHISQSFMLRLGWLLITADSMGFQLFRQRYLDACLRPRSPWFSSTIWLGTRAAIQTLVSDTHCSIGSGSTILFWTDNWLGYRLVDRIGIPDTFHHALLQPISDYYFDYTWHFTLNFLQIFPDIAFDIVSVPISEGEDRRAWTHSHFGEVSASLASDHIRPCFPTVDWGKWIWAPFIPMRRSIVTWRVILGRLATASSLRRSGLVGPGWCPLCRNANEDIDHLFWDCTFARQIWRSLFGWFRVDSPLIHDIGSLLLWAMKVQTSKQVVNLWRMGVMSTIWSIWNIRNRVVFDAASVSERALSIQIKSFILETSQLCTGEMANSVEDLLILHGLGVPSRPRRPTSFVYVFWIPPPTPWRKINIDGSVHGSPPLIHAGGVIRDSSSVLGCFHFSAGRGWAFEAELLALIIALEQSVNHGWRHVWIETDCAYLVDLFSSRSDTVPWRFFSRWRKVLSSLAGFHFIITHIYREGNRVADCLASSVAEEGYWNFTIPDILQLVKDDRRQLPYIRFAAGLCSSDGSLIMSMGNHAGKLGLPPMVSSRDLDLEKHVLSICLISLRIDYKSNCFRRFTASGELGLIVLFGLLAVMSLVFVLPFICDGWIFCSWVWLVLVLRLCPSGVQPVLKSALFPVCTDAASPVVPEVTSAGKIHDAFGGHPVLHARLGPATADFSGWPVQPPRVLLLALLCLSCRVAPYIGPLLYCF